MKLTLITFVSMVAAIIFFSLKYNMNTVVAKSNSIVSANEYTMKARLNTSKKPTTVDCKPLVKKDIGKQKYRLIGQASYYHDKYNGKLCADGKTVFNNKYAYGASCELPFGTKVEITNLKNYRKWTVVIVDRGPFDVLKTKRLKKEWTDSYTKLGFDLWLRKVGKKLTPHPTRIIDVSSETARMLGFKKDGVTDVQLKIISDKG
jgi:rare lipoprotein A (peptidoglycan hydrolase)